MRWFIVPLCSLIILGAALALATGVAGDAALGTQPYEKFEKDAVCAECHVDIARQHEQNLMSQSFTHAWDEVEYYQLALPHAERVAKVAGIKAGCNGCHAPLAFLAGDIPPKRPSEGTRANEGVSCDLCHSITGFEGDVPFNFNFVVSPGETKQGVRTGTESPHHQINANPFLATAEFCGTCHNEKDPWGLWVKATHLEWQKSPQAEAGITCLDCHMPKAAGNSAPEAGGQDHTDVRQHLFHGAHDTGKLMGTAEVRIHPSAREAKPGSNIVLTATVVNAKAGHAIPSGSAEERVVWLDVTATDSAGKSYHLAVDPKGFEGEDMTIASADAMAYQDIGDIKQLKDFPGLKRDGQVPAGDRIFRLPYLDSKGRMTVAQWNTAAFGPDYRLHPLDARNETFSWTLPKDIAKGPVTVRAEVRYSRLIASVAEYLGIPDEEVESVLMGVHETTFVVD